MNKIIFLGWVLLPCNIIGLCFCIYSLQSEIRVSYLLATGLFIAQISYIAKSLQILKQFELSREKLESAVKKAGLSMIKFLKRGNGK
jgi:hypothetical protein